MYRESKYRDGLQVQEQLVEDAFTKTHQEAESVWRDPEGKRLWETAETTGKARGNKADGVRSVKAGIKERLR